MLESPHSVLPTTKRAEMHAVDMGTAMLRYGHARAESLEARNANEPFARGFRRFDFKKAFVTAGFDPESRFCGTRDAVYLKRHLPPVSFVGAVKAWASAN